jgi:ribosomal protein S12 methylthiotransferase accessory factor
LCYYGPSPADDNFVFESSNGCATGSCLEEAILFGLLELIERDAFLLGWYAGAAMTEIDLASTTSGTVRAMLDRAEMLGYDVRAIDNRIDLGVPVVTGVAVRRDGGPGRIAFGAGAGLDPETAIEAALSEVLTYIPHLPQQVRDRRSELSAMAGDFSLVRELHDHAQLFGLPEMSVHAGRYLRPAGTAPVTEVFADHRPSAPRTSNLLDDIAYCLTELERIGIDPVVVDQTTAEQHAMGLRTVRVLAPGLLPIDFGWARQRALRMPRLLSALPAGAEPHRVPHPFP